MSDKNKKKYIIFAAAAILLFDAVLSAGRAIVRIRAGKTDTALGLACIKQAEGADIQAVRHKIKMLKENGGEASPETDYKIIFEDLAIMGDSIPAALRLNGHLFPSCVIADANAPYKNQIETLKSLDPEIIFISYGADEIASGGTDPERFASLYAVVLDSVAEELPDSRIFVNSVFPARADTARKMPQFSRLKEYNEKLKEICDKRNIGFIDNSDLAAKEFYEDDGIHFKSEFYPRWLERMAKAAELS